jgi:outer membrane lipoprotein-sorting protein
VKSGRWLLLAALFLVACSNAATSTGKPPTAQEILGKPYQANVKDAHFTLAAHVVSGSTSFDASGDGVIVIKPQQASHFAMTTTIAGQNLRWEVIIVNGKEYDLSPDNPRWTVRDSGGTSNPSSFKGTDATLVGEETLPLGKAWHVKAKDPSGNPIEAWIRERDGYPLKYVYLGQGSTFSATFDRFDTGQTINAPPASDIQS